MDRAMRFRINSPQVVHQTIDGEVVIINLESGCYYSLDNVAAEVWALLENHAAVGEVAHALGRRYDAAAETISSTVDHFVANLCDESLLLPSPDATTRAGSNGMATAGDSRAPFEAPTLQKYTDMKDLLLIDPIHEVDGLGWPGVNRDGRDR
jgi:hypothetical protein